MKIKKSLKPELSLFACVLTTLVIFLFVFIISQLFPDIKEMKMGVVRRGT